MAACRGIRESSCKTNCEYSVTVREKTNIKSIRSQSPESPNDQQNTPGCDLINEGTCWISTVSKGKRHFSDAYITVVQSSTFKAQPQFHFYGVFAAKMNTNTLSKRNISCPQYCRTPSSAAGCSLPLPRWPRIWSGTPTAPLPAKRMARGPGIAARIGGTARPMSLGHRVTTRLSATAAWALLLRSGHPRQSERSIFRSSRGTYTLGTAGQTITLNNGIVKSGAAATVSIISPVTLGANQTWTNNGYNSAPTAATGSLSATGGLDNGGFTLTIDGIGTTNFGSTASIISGAGGLIKNGTGTLILSGAGTAPIHTYSGDDDD